jgi:phenylalanyl-tRNA synthetase beta chain
MNILIPHTWLLEHLDTAAKPETIAKYLSLSGPSVERIIQIENEPVYDIEITTNRVDTASVRGIAREAAAILPQAGIKASLKPLETDQLNSDKALDITIINNPRLCHRILAIKLTSITIKDSPALIQKRLIQVGARPLNNVIDITNYVMWEIGHPVHAFDYDRLTGKKIIVREAKKGEALITLDDQKKTLTGGEVVFDDGTGTIIDLPGIMGTKNTAVTAKTKNVLLWLESIDAVKIRHASMGLDLRSQAAVLNEKHVDPNLGLDAIKVASKYYQEICRARVDSKLTDIYPSPSSTTKIVLKQTKLDTYLGITLKPDLVVNMLKNLSCQTSYNKKTSDYTITPPSYRAHDLTIYQDIIEEIARLHGYYNLNSTIMATPIPDNTDFQQLSIEQDIKNWLIGWGLQEIYSYSMVSEKQARMSGFNLNSHLKILNPLSQDLVYLRRSLIPSLIKVIQDNPDNQVTVFELANCFHPNGPGLLPNEQLQLGILSNVGYYQLKGILEALFQRLHIDECKFSPHPHDLDYFNSKNVAQIKSGSSILGYIGETHKTNVYAAVLDAMFLKKLASTHPKKVIVYELPPIIEDLTFTLTKNTSIGDLIDSIKSHKWVVNVHYDRSKDYQNNKTFSIHYRDPEKPLSAVDIKPLRKKIVSTLKRDFQVNLVGTLD